MSPCTHDVEEVSVQPTSSITSSMNQLIQTGKFTTAGRSSPNSAIRKRRFWFPTALEVLLATTVSDVKAHVAPRNEKYKIMQGICDMIISSLPANIRATCFEPTWNTVNDHFKVIKKIRRD